MYTRDALLDVHARCHRSLEGLLVHCEGFPDSDLEVSHEGFGYATLGEQFQHVVGAEQYWVGVLRGLMLTDEDDADRASWAAVRAFRDRVVETTTAWLHAADDDHLNEARRCTTWGGNEVELVPAHVVLRTQTHLFQHCGQITAMCRLLGRPVSAGLDFPLR